MRQDDRRLSRNALAEYREEVIDLLKENFAHGHLSLEEFEDRLETATGSGSRAGLSALTADLPALRPDLSSRAGGAPMINTGRVKDDQTLLALFSRSVKRGAWRPARNVKVVSLFGKQVVDFREAHFPPGEITLLAVSLFGKTKVLLPRGVTVNAFGAGIGGSFQDHTSGVKHASESPTVDCKGFALFGRVDIFDEE